jgi:hypothetical protein
MADPTVGPAAKELIARLPKTFRPAFNDQLRQWDLLFPAEQRQLQAQLDWLSRLNPEDFKQLFAPIVALESKMDLPGWESGTAGVTVKETGVLARSPLYPQWRGEVAKVFARIDDAAVESDGLKRVPRLLLCILPAGLPIQNQPLWPELAKQGTWVALDKPFGQMQSQLALALAQRKLPAGLQPIESTWALEYEPRLSTVAEASSATVLSWTALEGLRRTFMEQLNGVRRDLKSVDETHEELKRMDIRKLLDGPTGSEPRVREFVRGVLLSGNGSLLFGNSFVQWSASETLRRVQPQVLVAGFGIRPKLKPFSSVSLFEDQNRSNPVKDEDDPAGSLVDGMMLSQYVYLSAQRQAAVPGRTLTLMAAGDLNRVLLLGFPAAGPAPQQLTSEELTSLALHWLAA